MLRTMLLSVLVVTALSLTPPHAAEPGMNLRLVNNPALSPDGQTLAFDWNGDIWMAPTTGGSV